MKIIVLGGGTFGTAIANALKKEHDIMIFSRNVDDMRKINDNRKNERYFPNKILSKQIRATNDINDLEEADVIFICMPSHVVVDFFRYVRLKGEAIIVNGAKGFGENGKLIPFSLSEFLPNSICSLKGPSFADELIYELPTAFTCAGKELKQLYLLSSLFRDDIVRFDYSNNVNGVEILSILKNIYAIIVGIVDASFNSANVRFMLLTKAVNEIKNIIEMLSIPLETLFKYAGIGDLALTALNDLSRNRTFGLLIGKGFLDAGMGNSIVLEGRRSVHYLLKLLSDNEWQNFLLLFRLSRLLKNEINVNDFVRKAIFN